MLFPGLYNRPRSGDFLRRQRRRESSIIIDTTGKGKRKEVGNCYIVVVVGPFDSFHLSFVVIILSAVLLSTTTIDARPGSMQIIR